ncbi:MAG: hypothetical protein ACFBSE_12580 [Prochloraceae cyanobacterium]
MTQLLNSINTDLNFGTTVKIDMANNLILAREEHHQEGEHHNKEAEAKEGEHHHKEAEAKEAEHHHKEAEAKEGEHHHKEGEHHKEAEGEEGEEVAAFVPTTDFSAEYIIYFGAGLLSLAILAVVIIWIKEYSSEGE